MNLKEVLGDAYKEGMTFEEVEAALEKVTVPEDHSAEIERLKNALSKSNSEAAGYKKQLREKMTEDEQKKQKEQEEREELQNKYDKLLRESVIAKNKAKLVALGYEEALADETAEAMADGDSEKVFANQQKHLTSFEKKGSCGSSQEYTETYSRWGFQDHDARKVPKTRPDGASQVL